MNVCYTPPNHTHRTHAHEHVLFQPTNYCYWRNTQNEEEEEEEDKGDDNDESPKIKKSSKEYNKTTESPFKKHQTPTH